MNKKLTTEQQSPNMAAANLPASEIAPIPTPTTMPPLLPTPAPPTDKPSIITKRIGGTTFQVAVYFSKTSKETMNDKISRLIKHEAASGKAAGL